MHGHVEKKIVTAGGHWKMDEIWQIFQEKFYMWTREPRWKQHDYFSKELNVDWLLLIRCWDKKADPKKFHLYDGDQYYGGNKPDSVRGKATTIPRLLEDLPTYSRREASMNWT